MDTAKITKERLAGWEKVCNQQKATPQILITLNPVTATPGVIVTEDITISQIKTLLVSVLNSL